MTIRRSVDEHLHKEDFLLPSFRTRMDARLRFGNDVDNMCGILKGETNRAPRVLVVIDGLW